MKLIGSICMLFLFVVAMQGQSIAPATMADPSTDVRSSKLVKPAVYVEEVSSGGGIMASSDTALEAIKTLQQKGIRVVTIKEKADFVLQVVRQLGKKSWKKDTKVVLANREGEVVFSNSTRTVGGGVGDVADYIKKHSE
jgi:hypothetical protein